LSIKQVNPRRRAILDVEEIIGYYVETSPEDIALGFIEALEAAYKQIGQHPAIGSLRHSYELELPGLRARKLKRFPYLVFYVERDDHIDVWRVLHSHRDIPRWMQEPTESP